MNKLFCLALLQLPMVLFAQDTLYFDAAWTESTRDQHAYYRLLPMKKMGELVFIQDFYKNGNLQMQGYARISDETVYVGDAYWYDEQGYDMSTKQSTNRSEVRELTYYHADGSVWKKMEYGSDGRISKIRTYLQGEELSLGHVDRGHQYSGVFSPAKPARYYEQPEDEAVLVEEVEDVPIDDVERVDTAAQEMLRYCEVVFWTSGKKAMEKQFDRYGGLLRTMYWDQAGQLLADLQGDEAGKRFTYFTKNGLASGFRIKEELTDVDGNKRVQATFNTEQLLTDKTTFIDGEIAEVRRYEDGKEMAIQRYRDGQPYDGQFTVNLGEMETTFTMLQGERVGQALTRNLQTGILFADGIYKQGKPFEGSFYNTGDVYALLRYKNGQQDGIQTIFADYDGKLPAETVEMKAGLQDGLRRIYVDENFILESVYKAGKVVSGTIVEGKSQLVYQDGLLIKKLTSNGFQADEIAMVEKYSKNVIDSVAYTDFTLTENPQELYQGVYKDGKPYNGYFKIDTLVDNIALISLFEEGNLRYQYSFELLDQMDSYRHYTYDKKTSYVNGKVIDGPTYALIGRERLITSYYAAGKLQAFDVNVFAMHYFNRLTLKLEQQALHISELAAPLQLRAFPEGNAIVAELRADGELLQKSHPIAVLQDGAAYSITQYYVANNAIHTFTRAIDTLADMQDALSQEYNDSFVRRLFYLFPVLQSADLETVFQQLYLNFKQASFDRIFETSLDESYPVNAGNYLGYLRYDENGRPLDGLRLTMQADSRVLVQAFADGKMKETKVFTNLNDLLKDDRAALQALEHRMLND
ncbi:hypothetical protein PQ465_06690 [Sphingobacterium oryzagri]|uniref:Antitoxin component YwqK of the YwqJK toxin-antitoxin module n=1 Tax=Sphingobacterium oryzagri TaxID=3025669 RepID=A0ABY7WP07_9SPHI|nr:hypothetical protein [Sphingobacterium sp. KACC 22765]WDF70060.1 hypothetical protein PQ465_06690 [Sphingobacterium sp. KACC 22765]